MWSVRIALVGPGRPHPAGRTSRLNLSGHCGVSHVAKEDDVNEERFKQGLRVLADEASPSEDALLRLAARRRGRAVRRRFAEGLATIGVVTILSVVALQVWPESDPALPRLNNPPPGSSSRVAEQVAFSFEGDIYVHDIDGATRRITDDGYEALDMFPALHGSEQVWWVTRAQGRLPSVLWEMDLTSGRRSALVEIDDDVQAFGAHEGHQRLAFIVAGPHGEQQRLSVLDIADPRFDQTEDRSARWDLAEEFWSFPRYLGRGTSGEDEVAVAWSPEGERLLVVNTFVDTANERTDETLLVLDAAGRTVRAPVHGTFGRWVTDDVILFRAIADDTWRVVDLGADGETAFPDWPSTGAAPVISPDGRMVVMHDERPAPELPRLYAADLQSGRALLGSAFEGIRPIWLDDRTLVATGVEACPEDCMEHWRFTAETFRVTLDDDQRSPFEISATSDACVRFVMTTGDSE